MSDDRKLQLRVRISARVHAFPSRFSLVLLASKPNDRSGQPHTPLHNCLCEHERRQPAFWDVPSRSSRYWHDRAHRGNRASGQDSYGSDRHTQSTERIVERGKCSGCRSEQRAVLSRSAPRAGKAPLCCPSGRGAPRSGLRLESAPTKGCRLDAVPHPETAPSAARSRRAGSFITKFGGERCAACEDAALGGSSVGRGLVRRSAGQFARGGRGAEDALRDAHSTRARVDAGRRALSTREAESALPRARRACRAAPRQGPQQEPRLLGEGSHGAHARAAVGRATVRSLTSSALECRSTNEGCKDQSHSL